MPTALAEKIQISPKLIVSFVAAVRDVFTTMVNSEVKVGEPCLKDHPGTSYDVSGIIGFSGHITGSVVVSFQMEAAMKLVEAFAGVAMEAGSADFADAIGELANMIAGGAKKNIGPGSSISVPSVVIGKEHSVARLSDVPCIIIPCTTSVGNFAVEINIKQVGHPGK